MRLLLLVAAPLGAAAAAVSCVSCSGGHLVRAEFAAQHGADFDFSRPPCVPAPPPPAPAAGEAVVRYLGAGGLLAEWQGEAVLFGPHFSNPPLGRVLAGRWRPDEPAIAAGLSTLPLERVRAILVGHTHYDHFAEIPWVAPRTAPGAPIYVNRSGKLMLAAYPELEARARPLEEIAAAGAWVTPADERGRPLPFRFRALPSAHAPHLDHYSWARGEVRAPWREPWTEHAIRDFRAGRTFAFALDLLAPGSGEPRFRLYYGDAAAPAGQGYPPAEVDADGRAFDLAALCVPNYHLVEGYPQGILGRLRPRHVLAVHFEDFFRPRSRPLRFVALLTDARVDGFLRRVRGALEEGGQALRPPLPPVCGPASDGWTMPLPGEALRFTVLQ